jgi:outer membrane receptor protein involved in Fe transport
MLPDKFFGRVIGMHTPIIRTLLLSAALAAAALAQDTTGTITGTVADPSGAVVAAVEVRILNTQTGFSRTTLSGDAGEYRIPFVPPGVYDVTAQRTGFKSQVQQAVRIDILQTRTVNFALELGATSETVEVQSTAPLLEAETSQAGTVIKNEQVNNLPLNVRQFMQLTFLSPMATPATSDFRSTEINRDVAVPAAAGQRPEQNNYQIDGIDNRESGRNGFAIAPPVDSVSEFKVQTGMAPAEFGRGGGVIINVLTKSGTNQYHGSAYEFLRNNKLDARPFFSNRTNPLKRNQFGGAVGGPIRKDKLFFFGNYEGLQQAATGNPPVGRVLTPQEKAGVFTTAIVDPLNNKTPFPNNTIPVNRIDPISRAILPLFPDPNNPAELARNFIFNAVPSARTKRNNVVGRIDDNISNKDNIYGRYLFNQEETVVPPNLPEPSLSNGRNFFLRAQGASAGWNHVISPALITNTSLGYTRYTNRQATLNSYRQDFITPAGITNTLSATDPLFWAAPSISIAGVLAPGDATPNYRTMNQYQLQQSAVWNRGRHTLKAGGEMREIRTNMFFTGGNGSWAFTNSYSGNNIADFLLGLPSSANKTARATQWNTKVRYLGVYLQDDWKVTRRLTLNLGLRYEVESAINQSDHCGLGMSLPSGTEIISNQCKTLPQILAFSRDIRPDVKVETTDHTAPYNADVNNFGPRVGFAYQLTSKTVLRGGYGIFYDAPQVQSSASSNDFAPNTLRPTWTANPVVPDLTWNPEGAVKAESALKNAALTVFPFLSRDFPYGKIQQWNLNVQRQFGRDVLMEVMYQGSRGTNLIVFDNADFRAPGPGNVQSLLPYPQYARIQAFNNWATSSYQGTSVKIEQRPRKGFSYLLAYTFSKSIDLVSTLNSGPVWTDPFNRRTARGPSDFDARNRFSAAYSYELPFGKGKALLSSLSPGANKLVGGWGVRGVTFFQTGLPQSPSMNLSRTGICSAACVARPDRIGEGNLSKDERTLNRFYDVGAFRLLAAGGVEGRVGNAGRNILTGPGVNNFDLQVFKETRLGERHSLDFRWEMFNAFNHAQWTAPSVNLEAPATFGVITNTRDPRIMQFVLRYSF